MLNANSRDTLIENINKFFLCISDDHKKKVEEEITHDEKISYVQFWQLYSGRTSVDSLSDAELYWLIFAISKVTGKAGKPQDYFEDSEIKNYKYYLPEENNEVSRPIVFKDVIKLAENQYMFPCSIAEIQKLKNANVLQIVPELQRNSTKNKYNELKTKVNQKTARQIANLIDEGKFFYNGIRFNLMDDGDSDEPVYDADNHTLTINNGIIIVPDGNHRTIGCELATKHLDDKFCVFFTFLSARDTRSLLNQEWTIVPIPKKHKESMKQTPSNEIVDGIIRSADSDPIYAKEIVKDGLETRSGHGFILYSELANAINRYYNADSLEPKSKRDELRDWLISYMNYLTELLFDDFKNYKKYYRRKWSVAPTAWYFYIMISKIVYHRASWREDVKQIIEKYNFDDQDTKSIFSMNNKRKIITFCNEQEAIICTMLKENSSF